MKISFLIFIFTLNNHLYAFHYVRIHVYVRLHHVTSCTSLFWSIGLNRNIPPTLHYEMVIMFLVTFYDYPEGKESWFRAIKYSIKRSINFFSKSVCLEVQCTNYPDSYLFCLDKWWKYFLEQKKGCDIILFV